MVQERIDPVLGKLVWKDNIKEWWVAEPPRWNLFGKEYDIKCALDVDEDEMPFEEAVVLQREAVRVIWEHQEELSREMEQKILDYVNEKIVASITYGEYDPISGEHCLPFSSLCSLGTVVESGSLLIPVAIDKYTPVCFLFNLVHFDAGVGVGIEGYKVKEVSDHYRFI